MEGVIAALNALIRAAVAFAAHVEKMMNSEPEFVKFQEPRNRFQGFDSASLCTRRAGTSNRFVVPAPVPGLVKRSTNTGSDRILFTIPGFENVQHITL
jgi:hypothetical protein